MRVFRIYALTVFCFFTAALLSAQDRKILIAHYMPWYASKEISNVWGWHWTMGKLDPDKGEIASHFHPAIGPYDSANPAVLEYHALLMKIAGIDGVIFDWYGIHECLDYGMIHRNTESMIRQLGKTDLKFAVCYEDQTLKHMIANGCLAEGGELARGVEVVSWMQANWFQRPSYIKVEDRPLLLVFGPQKFTDEKWEALLRGLSPRPWFMTLNDRRTMADGAFAWPPVHGNRIIPTEQWQGHLNHIHSTDDSGSRSIAAVFPGFHDFYAEAGLHESYGRIEERDGATFRETLAIAAASKSKLVQLVTWNDFGEGTNIEPTKEYGFKYLELIQDFRRTEAGGAAFVYTKEDLSLPLEIFRLRKAGVAKEALDSAAAAIIRGNCAEARNILAASAN